MDTVQILDEERGTLPAEQATPTEQPEAQELTSKQYELPNDPAEAIEFFYKQGWTDGLPVVPPTPARVQEFLYWGGKHPGEVLGVIPARNRIITAEKVAINAVMAGCLPSYMPVILAAFEAILTEEFNIHGNSASTGGSAPLLIVNGSIVQELNINGGANCFGAGVRANATIGRAIRLALMNVGGTIPGVIDRSTLGHPGKYSYCIAEDEAGNPWQPLSVERGIPADVSAVTVFAGEAPHYVSCPLGNTPDALVGAITNVMFSTLYRSGYWVLVLCPEHVAVFKKAGWTKDDIRQAIYNRAQRPYAEFKRISGIPESAIKPKDAETPYRYMTEPDKMLIVTAGGGAGAFSAIVPPWAAGDESIPVTKAIGVCLDC